MKTIVGLGNPGKKYIGTRHNIGFQMIDLIKNSYSFPEWQSSKKFSSLLSEGNIDGKKTLLVKPQTFMNHSGLAICKILNFYKISLDNLLIVHDDFDLKLGVVRLRGNSEGKSTHNGIRSIVQSVGSPDFVRIRLGVGTDTDLPKDVFVLQRFSSEESEVVEDMLNEGFLRIEKWLSDFDY